MRSHEKVSTVMTRHLYTLNPTDTLHKAQKMMTEFNIRHLPVTSGGELLGIISLTDLQRISFAGSFGSSEVDTDLSMYDMLTIPQVMRAKPHSIKADAPLREAAEVLMQEEFHALPVIDGDSLVGIITTTDVLRFLLEETKPLETPKGGIQESMKGVYD